jgi:hypothetical protein
MGVLDRADQAAQLPKQRQVSADDAYLAAYPHERRMDPEWPHAYRLEDYRSGRLEIHIHLRVRFGEFKPEQWCAVYKRSLVPQSAERARFGVDRDVIGGHAESGNVHKTVLVDVIELGEPPERREPFPGLESVVWLRPLNRCAGRFAETRDTILDPLAGSSHRSVGVLWV